MKNNSSDQQLTIKKVFDKFEKIIEISKDNLSVRKAIITAICQQIYRYSTIVNPGEASRPTLQNIAPHLQEFFNKLTRSEIYKIVEILTEIYLKERENLQGSDEFIRVQELYYPIWLTGTRPLTTVEEIILQWLGNKKYPIAQQVAMQAKVEFANALDQEEERRIKEIRERRGLLNTDLDNSITGELRRFFPDKIIGILATIDKEPYRSVVSKVLPEAFHQDQSQHKAVDFVLRNWRDDENNQREIATGLQLGTTSYRLGVGLTLAKYRRYWIVPSAIVAVGALGYGAYAAKTGADGIISIIVQPPPPPPPCLPPQEPDRGIFVLPAANVKDIDSSDFDMGKLTVEFSKDPVEFSKGATVEDRLWIHHQGEIGIDCNKNITYKGEVIGKVEGGNGTQPLVVTFNNKSTPDIATALLGNIEYANISQKPLSGSRELKFKVSDGKENGDSKSITKIINLTTENQAPVVKLPGNQNVKESKKLIIGGISISDSDSQKLTVILSVNSGTLDVQSAESKIDKSSTAKNDKPVKPNLTKEVKVKNEQAVKPTQPIKGNKTKTVILTGTVTEINTVLANAITYQGYEDFSGEDSLTVTVNDNGKIIKGSTDKNLVYPENALKAKTVENQKINITVVPLKPPAVVKIPADKTVKENTNLPISGISITDPNNSPNLTVTVETTNGVLTVKNDVNKGLTSKEIKNNVNQTIKFTGNLIQINTTLANPKAIIYKPNKDFQGKDTVTITVDNGSKKPTQSRINITVDHLNKPPEIIEAADIRNNIIQTIPPTVSPPESIPHTPERTSKSNSSNSSYNVAFPKSSCGDPLPENPQAYPVNFYPVFIDYNENNFSVVRARFCGDALKKTREKTGKLAIQVSSFTSINRAEAFKNLMKANFGSGEVGEPTVKKSKN